jgi:hypothetical protein
MRKYISLIVGLALVSYSALADFTPATTLHTATMTGIYTNGPIKVTKVIVIAPTPTNVSLSAVDSANGLLAWTNAAYTNTISSVTNVTIGYSNYYGVMTLVTNNNALVDITNNLVAGSTNYWPVKFSSAVAANSSSTISGVSYTFYGGLWITNTGLGDAIVIFEYQRLY